MDIEGLGPKILEQLIKEGLIKHEGDLYKITEDDLKPLERFAEKSAENLVESVKNSKIVSLGKFIYALGILNVGEETAYDLALRFGTLESIESASIEKLEKVQDVGSVVAKSIYNYFHDERNLNKIRDLLKSGVKIEGQRQTKSKITGKSFVVTGGLESYSREEAKQAIRDRGGEVHETVTKETNYVVVGTEPGSKYDKAKKLGTTMISEKKFKNLLK
jgi:DNA ligase (NAD+)